MRIRPLQQKDIPGMLEWMHDPSIHRFFRFAPEGQTEQTCLRFVQSCMTETGRHYAIVDDADVYLGTVSLKYIDRDAGTAEYAIGMRIAAHGTGASAFGTNAVLHIAFQELGLSLVYLNVLDENVRAWRFYEKIGFVYEGMCGEAFERDGRTVMQRRYHMTAECFLSRSGLSAVRMLEFMQRGDARGHLVVAEGETDIPFAIQRIFYIYGSDADVVRGQHANRFSEFVLINVSGTSKVRVTDGRGNEAVFSLTRPHTGIYIPTMVWKEMYDFSPDSVLLCLSNAHYDATEYIRDFAEYVKEVNRA